MARFSEQSLFKRVIKNQTKEITVNKVQSKLIMHSTAHKAFSIDNIKTEVNLLVNLSLLPV